MPGSHHSTYKGKNRVIHKMPGFSFGFYLSTAFYLAITAQKNSSLAHIANFHKKM